MCRRLLTNPVLEDFVVEPAVDVVARSQP